MNGNRQNEYILNLGGQAFIKLSTQAGYGKAIFNSSDYVDVVLDKDKLLGLQEIIADILLDIEDPNEFGL